MSEEIAKIPNRRKAFVAHYLHTWNATEAARKAGYLGDDESLATAGSRLLRNDKVQAAIQKRLTKMQMSADETLVRIISHATADLSPYIRTKDTDGKPCRAFVDVDAMLKAGRGHLIRELGYTKSGDVVVKTFDQQKALEMLGKAHGLFKDRMEHSGPNGGPIRAQAVPVDYSKLSVEELRQLLAMAEKMALPSAAQGGGQ